MAEPLSLSKTFREKYFEPEKKLVVYFVNSKYDAVWKRDMKQQGKIVQYYPDLLYCKKDCADLRNAMKAYQITDTGPSNMYNMDNNPSSQQTNKTIASIRSRLKAETD